jgi:hypothetical protein
MPGDLESVFDFPVQARNVNVEELGEIFWDFTKRATKTLYDQFTNALAKNDIQLTKKGQIVLTRQLLIINMWSVCKAWMEAEDALETMHQKYLRGVSLFFEEHAKQEDIWAFSKKELMARYKEYYGHWMNNDLNVSGEKIVALAASMLRDMIQQPELILGGKYQSMVINHLKVVLKPLLKMKQEYTVNL